ncbi:MAG: transposase [Thermodesulfobacteriota bacterium]|nr:transposase [Thermodesulfobacteriota bacterium]
MPRQPRIDSPNLLHHVIVRGIERGEIFYDDEDRSSFVERLRMLLLETNTDCYAWALIPNHFHLLLRPHSVELSRFMRRLLTGYAVTFNRRHNRSGHLFQNRYKSIVCEEETYLLELIRYIHLNPLRAGLVENQETLEQYPWCGHAELLGQNRKSEFATDWVLSLFSRQKKSAQQQYQQFIADGIKQGKRPELVGGGLRRSQSGHICQDEPQLYDERVLGSGDFVQQLQENGLLDYSAHQKMTLDKLQIAVVDKYSISMDSFRRRARSGRASKARILFCYCAVRHLGHSGAATARHLMIGSSSVSRAVEKGERLIQIDTSLSDWISSLKH